MVEKKEEAPIVATPSTLPQLHITNPFLEDLMPSAVLIKTSDESPKRTSSSPNSYILVNDDDVFIDCEIDYAVKKQQQQSRNDSATAAADETAIAEAVISTRLTSSSASSTSSSRDGAALTDLEDEEEEDAGKQQNSDYDNVNNIAANNKQVKYIIFSKS